MTTRIRRAASSAGDRGASAVEYGLMLGAIAGLIIGVVFGFGAVLDDTFTKVNDCIAAEGVGAPYPEC